MRQLYAQNVQNIQLTMSQASPTCTFLNTITPTLTVETTLTSTTASSGRTTTINGIDRFYSEIENDHSSGIIDHGIGEEMKALITARPTTQSAQYMIHQQWSTKDVRSKVKESEKEELVGNMEETDTILPNSTDSEIFWKTSIPEVGESEKNTMLSVDDHIYNNNNEVALIADHSEVTPPPNTTLRSNCTLIMMQLNIFICLLASFHVYLNFSVPSC
ncbi:hypothetical protein QQG55_41045 [Brugia pahangi]